MTGRNSEEEILDRIEKAAHDYERDYHGCAQCVLLALQEHFGFGNAATFRAASALAGGIGLMGDSCGALTAGIMALGLVYGRENIENFSELQASLAPARRLYRRFQKEFGSGLCRDIQTSRLGRFFDIANEKDYEEFERAGGYRECPEVVGKAARLAAEVILEERAKATSSG